jgi:DNA-binding LytR/AlgR family response regulator
MQITICDDEKKIRELLGSRVQKLYPSAELAFYETGEALLAQAAQPDILFLDIQMPGRDGMEIARLLRKKWKDTILIFVTGIEEYVFQAFDVGAFHYIVKPLDEEKLKMVLENAVKQYEEMTQNSKAEKKYIMVQTGGIHTKVFVDDIVYAEVFNRKIIIHKLDGELEFYGKLSDLEKLLGEDFFRPHRAYLINMGYVESYDAGNIYLEKGQVIMAKQNYKKFVESYMQYSMK